MFLSHLFAAIHRWIAYRKTVVELSRLDDRELHDLGITRFDIENVARQSVA